MYVLYTYVMLVGNHFLKIHKLWGHGSKMVYRPLKTLSRPTEQNMVPTEAPRIIWTRMKCTKHFNNTRSYYHIHICILYSKRTFTTQKKNVFSSKGSRYNYCWQNTTLISKSDTIRKTIHAFRENINIKKHSWLQCTTVCQFLVLAHFTEIIAWYNRIPTRNMNYNMWSTFVRVG